jgi:hypothetical protein
LPNTATLKKRVDYLVDDSIDFQRAVDLFNQCLDDLSEVARYEKKEIYTLTPINSNFTLPADYIGLVSINQNGKEIKRMDEISKFAYSMKYKQSLNEIDILQIDTPVEVTLHYYAHLPYLSDASTDETPALSQRFHQLLPLYAAIKYMQNWDGETNQLANYAVEYEKLKEELRLHRIKETRHYQKRTVVQSRGWSL